MKQPNYWRQKKNYPEGRSSIDCVRSNEISCICWYNNRALTLATNFCNKEPVTQVKRYDRQNKRSSSHHYTFNCTIQSVYGGVDKIDCLTALYKFRIVLKRWYVYLFNHMVKVSILYVIFCIYMVHCKCNIISKLSYF